MKNTRSDPNQLKQRADEGDLEAMYDYGLFLWFEKNEVDEAEYWFKKAVEADCLIPPAAHEYGLLLIEERKSKREGLNFLRLAAEEGHEISEEDLLLYEQ
ncbi:MAG: sel1 repeat family protein [bacterium]|nr:MAG: sel1 repeat family protein [bacterium]